MIFSTAEFGRAAAVRELIMPWAARNDILTATYKGDFAIALDIPAGEEMPQVVRSLVESITAIGTVLEALPPLNGAGIDIEPG
jgi:hypothetical protein